MIRLNLEQQTPAWHQWRARVIGGSDAPAIMGVSPYATREQLLQEKLGLSRREQTFAMRQGLLAEETARILYQTRLGMNFEPCCCVHEDLKWMGASLDGWHESGIILELKRPNWRDHDFALAGQVPDHYWPQVQHQLFCAGASECHYVSYSPTPRFKPKDQLAPVIVFPDAEYLAALLDAEEQFVREWQEHHERKTA